VHVYDASLNGTGHIRQLWGDGDVIPEAQYQAPEQPLPAGANGPPTMTSRLITTWTEYDNAVQEVLELSTSTLQIFDEDLSSLKLERPQRIAPLRAVLTAHEYHKRLAIVVQKPDFVRQYSPQLMDLLKVHAPTLTITQSPPHLDTLKDSLLIADGKHALVCFHREQPRARLIIDDVHECTPYVRRFEEILAAGGDPVSAMTLGL
jgi:hypothetical protein